MTVKLTEQQKNCLRLLEPQLQIACQMLDLQQAEIIIIKKIQKAFINDRNHFRVLRAKNWYFGALLDTGKTQLAKRGFESIRERANEGTRVHLEATAFLGICFLRLKEVENAKEYIQYVVFHTNDIKSDQRRQQYEIRLIERIRNEYILSQLIGQQIGELIPEEIHRKSIEMVRKPDDEVFELMGSCLPSQTQSALKDITDYTINLLPPKDQKLLQPSRPAPHNRELGKQVTAVLKRITWRTFCDESSEIHSLWSNRIPKVFNQGYFALAVTTSLTEWKIGVPQLAVGLTATVMKYGCKEFCDGFKPKGLMISIKEK